MYGYIWRAQQPVETYIATHKEVVDLVGSNDPDGLLVHLVYGTEQGFNMVEVWESREQFDAFSRDIVSQVYQRLGLSTDGPPQDVTEFEPVEVINPQVRTHAHEPLGASRTTPPRVLLGLSEGTHRRSRPQQLSLGPNIDQDSHSAEMSREAAWLQVIRF
jgi:hypothetical protein